MTTITARGSDDDFDRVERGIDWLERLEVIKARQDRESAIRETAEYVNGLREAIIALSADADVSQIAARHGGEVASVVESLRESEATDPWTEYLHPTLLQNQ